MTTPLLTITEDAQHHLLTAMQRSGLHDFPVRLRVIGRGVDSFLYDFKAVPRDDRSNGDHVIAATGFDVFIDAESAANLAGTTISLNPEGGFQIDNPNPVWHEELGPRVARVIDAHINPAVAIHGGQIALVNVEGNTVFVRMEGGCKGCGLAKVTLTHGIVKMIREAIPDIEDVIDVTAHDEGENPYFARDTVGESPMIE